MINKLIKLANTLDESGFKKEADQIDSLIRKNGAVLALPLLIPAIIEAAVLAGLATAAAYIIAIALSEAYNYLKELEKEHALSRESIEDAIDIGFNSSKYKEALRGKPDLGPEWKPPEEIMTIVISLLAGAFGVEYLLRDEAKIGYQQRIIENRKDNEDITEIDIEEMLRGLGQPDVGSEEEDEEEKVKTISCLAVEQDDWGNPVHYFYFDSEAVSFYTVNALCAVKDAPTVGWQVPGPLISQPGVVLDPHRGSNPSGSSTWIKGDPETEKSALLSWFCTNYPEYDAMQVHNQGAGSVHCSGKEFSVLYEFVGKMHGPWRCK
tara:strand:+ start:12525 stop:13490 length:966 start_codon:yes stop_codon:yes gene_type:complete